MATTGEREDKEALPAPLGKGEARSAYTQNKRERSLISSPA